MDLVRRRVDGEAAVDVNGEAARGRDVGAEGLEDLSGEREGVGLDISDSSVEGNGKKVGHAYLPSKDASTIDIPFVVRTNHSRQFTGVMSESLSSQNIRSKKMDDHHIFKFPV